MITLSFIHDLMIQNLSIVLDRAHSILLVQYSLYILCLFNEFLLTAKFLIINFFIKNRYIIKELI